MFDIDFYENYIAYNSEYETQLEDIENDVYYDINNLLNYNFDLFYKRDRFKFNKHNIDVIYPKHSFPEFKTILKGPNYIRFLLSLYPCKDDLYKVQSIILRPRHIEVDGTELISLYIRRENILVLYLYHPHLYHVNNSKFDCSEIFYSRIFSFLEKTKYFNKDSCNPFIMIPPLWYILSTISCSSDNKIEKFLVRRDDKTCCSTSRKISDISFRYSRLGY